MGLAKTVSLRSQVLEELRGTGLPVESGGLLTQVGKARDVLSSHLGLLVLLPVLVLIYLYVVWAADGCTGVPGLRWWGAGLTTFPCLASPDELRSFIGTLWSVHAVVLAISISVIVILTETTRSAEARGRWVRQAMLKRVLLYPVLAVGFAALITLGVNYVDPKPAGAYVNCVYFIATLTGIAWLYHWVWRIGDDQFWLSEHARQIAKRFADMLSRELVWHIGVVRMSEHLDETRFAANPWVARLEREAARRVLADKGGVLFDLKIPCGHALGSRPASGEQAHQDVARPTAGMWVGLYDDVEKGDTLMALPQDLADDEAERLERMPVIKGGAGKSEVDRVLRDEVETTIDDARAALDARNARSARAYLQVCEEVVKSAALGIARVPLVLRPGATPDTLEWRSTFWLSLLIRETARSFGECGQQDIAENYTYGMASVARDLLEIPKAPLFDLAAGAIVVAVVSFRGAPTDIRTVWQSGCRCLTNLLVYDVQPDELTDLTPDELRQATGLATSLLASLEALGKGAIDRRAVDLFGYTFDSITVPLHGFSDRELRSQIVTLEMDEGFGEPVDQEMKRAAVERRNLVQGVLDTVDTVAFGLGAWAWHEVAGGHATPDALSPLLSRTRGQLSHLAKLVEVFERAVDPEERHGRPWGSWELTTKAEHRIHPVETTTWLTGFYCWCGIADAATRFDPSGTAEKEAPALSPSRAIRHEMTDIRSTTERMRLEPNIWAQMMGASVPAFQAACRQWVEMNRQAADQVTRQEEDELIKASLNTEQVASFKAELRAGYDAHAALRRCLDSADRVRLQPTGQPVRSGLGVLQWRAKEFFVRATGFGTIGVRRIGAGIAEAEVSMTAQAVVETAPWAIEVAKDLSQAAAIGTKLLGDRGAVASGLFVHQSLRRETDLWDTSQLTVPPREAEAPTPFARIGEQDIYLIPSDGPTLNGNMRYVIVLDISECLLWRNRVENEGDHILSVSVEALDDVKVERLFSDKPEIVDAAKAKGTSLEDLKREYLKQVKVRALEDLEVEVTQPAAAVVVRVAPPARVAPIR
jgi:hypothetical protein